MPTYEYACTECGDRLEVVQRFSDDPLTTCGACGGRLRKVFSAVGIVFKGSGFYRTDSRSGAVGAGAGTNGKSADGAGSDSGSGDKADATPKVDTAKPAGDGGSKPAESASTASGNGSSGTSKKGTAGAGSKAGSKVA